MKADLDAPHHRPHEPFKDINFNGYWDNGMDEHWIDLNRNGDKQDTPIYRVLPRPNTGTECLRI